MNRVLESLRILTHFPESAPVISSDASGIVRAKVIDQLTIVKYRIVGDELHVEAIHDARTNWK